MTAPLENGTSPLDHRDDSGWERVCGTHAETGNRGETTINLLGTQQFVSAAKGLGGLGEPPHFYHVLRKNIFATVASSSLSLFCNSKTRGSKGYGAGRKMRYGKAC